MRRQSRSAFYVDGADRAGVELGWNCLLHTLDKTAAQAVWLVTPAALSLRGVVQEVLGEAVVNALLLNNDTATIGGRLLIKRFTLETLPYVGAYIAVLAICPTPKILDRLDSLNGVVSITVVAEDRETIRAWISRWQAVDAPSPTNK